MKPTAATKARAARLTLQPRRPAKRHRGRAWINGREVGGTAKRFAHLAATYD